MGAEVRELKGVEAKPLSDSSPNAYLSSTDPSSVSDAQPYMRWALHGQGSIRERLEGAGAPGLWGGQHTTAVNQAASCLLKALF